MRRRGSHAGPPALALEDGRRSCGTPDPTRRAAARRPPELAQVGDELGGDPLARAAGLGCPAGSRRSTRPRRVRPPRRPRRRRPRRGTPRAARRRSRSPARPDARTSAAASPGRPIRRTTASKSCAKRSRSCRRLGESEDQHHRRVRGQLDVDVEGLAQRGGDLVARAAGAADVDDDPHRVPGGDARPADELLADHAHAGNRVDRVARRVAGGHRAVEQRLAVHRELAPRGVERRHQQRRRRGAARQADHPRDRRRGRSGRSARRAASPTA